MHAQWAIHTGQAVVRSVLIQLMHSAKYPGSRTPIRMITMENFSTFKAQEKQHLTVRDITEPKIVQTMFWLENDAAVLSLKITSNRFHISQCSFTAKATTWSNTVISVGSSPHSYTVDHML